jgi:hypothetical protein
MTTPAILALRFGVFTLIRSLIRSLRSATTSPRRRRRADVSSVLCRGGGTPVARARGTWAAQSVVFVAARARFDAPR